MLCCLVKKCGAGTSVSHCLNVLFFYFSCMGSHGKQRNQRKRGPQKLTYSEDVLVLNSTELQFLLESMTCICIHLLMRATEKYLSTSQCCQKYEGWRTNWRRSKEACKKYALSTICCPRAREGMRYAMTMGGRKIERRWGACECSREQVDKASQHASSHCHHRSAGRREHARSLLEHSSKYLDCNVCMHFDVRL